jgi:transposase
MSSKYEDIDYEEMVALEYVEAHNLGMKPVIAAMCDVLNIPEFIDRFVGPLDPRVKISVGVLIKAMIINVLMGRLPLVHVENTFSQFECEILLGEGINPSDLNDDRLGNAIEKLGVLDYHKLYSEICMRAIDVHNAKVEGVHVDTTNISLQGSYMDPALGNFDVTFGDPKSKRKDLKQANIGLFVQQNGLPLGGTGLSGNTSDVVWFRDAMGELSETFKGDLNTRPIGIYDAAGSNIAMFDKAMSLEMPSIIRLSDRFKITGEHINKAWEEDNWVEVGTCVCNPDSKKNASTYKISSFDVCIGISDWRLIVVYSSELEKLKIANAKRNIPKYKTKIEKLSAKLSKTNFASHEEAEAAGQLFVKKNFTLKTPFKWELKVQKIVKEKYLKRGKPTDTSEKVTIIDFYVHVKVLGVDNDIYEKWLKEESCFVLVTNVPKERLADEGILREYKDQWLVEDKFKFLKKPVVLGPIWLQKKERINGLIFVLLLSVLVSLYVCYRIDSSLKDDDDTIKEEIPTTKEKDTIKKKSRVGKRILTSDGRLVERPTYKTIFGVLSSLKVLGTFQGRQLVYKFGYGTQIRLLKMVELIGFNPGIYIKPFSPKMDIWKYYKKNTN